MSTQIYLGLPSTNVVKWIKENYTLTEKDKPFYFEATSPETSFYMECYDGGPGEYVPLTINLEYSSDNMKSWQPFTGQTLTFENAEDLKLYFRAPKNITNEPPNEENKMHYNKFKNVVSGELKCGGNILSFINQEPENVINLLFNSFCGVFDELNIIQSPHIPLLDDNSWYTEMFDCKDNFKFIGNTSNDVKKLIISDNGICIFKPGANGNTYNIICEDKTIKIKWENYKYVIIEE